MAQNKAPVRDTNYDLVSVIYHLMQGAEEIDQYCQDAREQQDQDLESFFRDVQQTNSELAQKAQLMLKKRLQ